jgi:sugar lactone lactonase YvrE
MKMRVKEVAEKLGLKILATGSEQEVTGGYVSDLLSDVIANAEGGCLWITMQRHLNVVAVAQLKKLAGIIISHGIEPEVAVLERAKQEGLFVLSSQADSFHTAGRLYALIAVPK